MSQTARMSCAIDICKAAQSSAARASRGHRSTHNLGRIPIQFSGQIHLTDCGANAGDIAHQGRISQSSGEPSTRHIARHWCVVFVAGGLDQFKSRQLAVLTLKLGNALRSRTCRCRFVPTVLFQAKRYNA